MEHGEMLSRAQLSIVSAEPGDLDGVARTIAPSVRVGGCDELWAVLRRLAAGCKGAPPRPRTLDLFGHSTARHGLLRLGDWVIDAGDPAVTAWFRALADAALLTRLGIRALRLLACRTAATERGRATLCALADILGVEVYGTPHLLYDVHHDARGFRAEWAFLLVGSRELARAACASSQGGGLGTPEVDALWATQPLRMPPCDARSATAPDRRPCDVDAPCATELGPRTHDIDVLRTMELGRRALDVDALAAIELGPRSLYPRRIASPADARRIFALIEWDAGAPLGASVVPLCAIAIPAGGPGAWHLAEVLYGGAFLQLYPDGGAAPGVVFPVTDAAALLGIVDELSG